MGCTASKDGVETFRKSRSTQMEKSMSMPVQAQGNNDNGFHTVALTSSTYGFLKTDPHKKDGKDINSVSNSAQDAFYQKLKNFDVPDEMVTKPWSEVSRNIPKVPPLLRTHSPRRIDSSRRMDSPRQSRGIDSPRQPGSFRGMDSPRPRGSFRRTDSPRRLPSQAAKNDHETVDMWDLMDGLEEDGSTKPKLKPVERIPRSPIIKPFERSITFSTIHTLSELDSGDLSQAITPGPATNVLNNSKYGDVSGKENAKPVRGMPRSMSSPIMPKRDEIKVRLTPSSPAPRFAVPSSDPSHPRQQSVSPMMLTPEENATIQEVSKALLLPPSSVPRVVVRSSDPPPHPRQSSASPMTPTARANATAEQTSKALLPPPSPVLRSTVRSNYLPRPRQSSVSPVTPTLEANATTEEASKALLPPPSPVPRLAVRSSDLPRPRQPSVSPMTLPPEANVTTQEASKALLPPPSPVPRLAVRSSDLPRPRQPSVSPMTPTLEANATTQEASKALLPPPSPVPRLAVRSSDLPRPRQPSVSPMTLPPEANAAAQEVSKVFLPPPSPSLSAKAGTKNASVMQERNRPPGVQPSKSTVLKADNSPLSLNTKLEAEIERAMTDERGVSKNWVQSPAMRSLEPDLGRVRTVAASFSQEGAAGARSRPTPKRVDVNESSNQATTRQVPRFASPIHVLSLAASFDLENRKNSMSHLDLKGPHASPSPTTTKASSGRPSFSKQQSMPSPAYRAIPYSGQGAGLQSQASAPNHGRHRSLDVSANARVTPVSERGRDSNARSSLGGTASDSDLLASFEEALEMFSADEWYSVRESKGEANAFPGTSERNGMFLHNGLEEGVSGDNDRQGNGNKGANIHMASPGEGFAPASKGIAAQKRVKPNPWARFEKKCPPAGEDRVVLYTTSLRGIRKTFEDCNNARFIFQSFNVEIDERDVSIHAEFRQELRDLSEKPVPVPQAFIRGHYIGGIDTVIQLHEDGTLATLVGDLPPQLSRRECDGCGGVRFVPCSDCSGSTKIVNEAREVVRCGECNENGLMRCPICY